MGLFKYFVVFFYTLFFALFFFLSLIIFPFGRYKYAPFYVLFYIKKKYTFLPVDIIKCGARSGSPRLLSMAGIRWGMGPGYSARLILILELDGLTVLSLRLLYART